MGFQLNSKDYLDYICNVAKIINDNKDYITELDATTGDGDHWANMNMGFQKIVESINELKDLDLSSLLQKIGMIMMTTIGGSSGVLYGSGYIKAAKELKSSDVLDRYSLSAMLQAMSNGICERGKSEPGMKTMIDTLLPAANAYKKAIEDGIAEQEALNQLKHAAKAGMENTRNMEAVRGRAYYQAHKGVGHLDPGAVTMYYQIEALVDLILNKTE